MNNKTLFSNSLVSDALLAAVRKAANAGEDVSKHDPLNEKLTPFEKFRVARAFRNPNSRVLRSAEADAASYDVQDPKRADKMRSDIERTKAVVRGKFKPLSGRLKKRPVQTSPPLLNRGQIGGGIEGREPGTWNEATELNEWGTKSKGLMPPLAGRIMLARQARQGIAASYHGGSHNHDARLKSAERLKKKLGRLTRDPKISSVLDADSKERMPIPE